MKISKSLFLIAVGRGHLVSTVRKLLLCLLIPIGMALIIGCDCDIKDVSKEFLVITDIEPESLTLGIEKVATLKAMVIYSEDCEDLSYDWWTNGGRVDNNGKNATYVAPKTSGTYTITFEVSNGPITRTKTINAIVTDPPENSNSVESTGTSGDDKNTG